MLFRSVSQSRYATNNINHLHKQLPKNLHHLTNTYSNYLLLLLQHIQLIKIQPQNINIHTSLYNKNLIILHQNLTPHLHHNNYTLNKTNQTTNHHFYLLHHKTNTNTNNINHLPNLLTKHKTLIFTPHYTTKTS